MSNDSPNITFSAETTTIFNTTNPSSTLLSINMSNITKLSNLNYIMWSRQIRALLEGHELHGFIDDSMTISSATITTDGQTLPNLVFAPWRKQDQLLYSAIIGAISLPLQSVVSSATTTCEVWNILLTTFENPTPWHIFQLKYQIKNCTKRTKTISEYLRIIKAKADELALLGKPLDPEDLTEQILAGLSEDYKPEVDAVNGRDTSISYTELHEWFLNREAMIVCNETNYVPLVPITANVADSRQRQHIQNHNTWRSNNNRNNSSNNQMYDNQNRSSRPYLGRCHACRTQGHSAKYCPEFRIVCGHASTPTWQHPQQHQSWQPRANATMLSGSDSSTSLVDTGASHHMTSDLANLSLHAPYNGGDEVMLGDGSGLHITHSGSYLFPHYTSFLSQ